MKAEDREPTRDELLAMAYADGELADEARTEFEQRLAKEPALAREVATLKRLELIARRTAPKEPMDHEWDRLRRDTVHRGGTSLGFTMLLVGTLGAAGWAVVELALSELALLPKLLALLAVGGLAVLFLVTLRARMRTLPYDPYTEVQR